MNILRIDISTREYLRSTLPETHAHLGGRGLTSRLLLDEVPADCDPLGPLNKLIFAPGLLSGLNISSCDRLSIGAKSPLTGGVKESNSGGTTALHLTRLGIAALILEGQSFESQPLVIHVSAAGVRFDPASDLSGVGIYESARVLSDRYGSHTAIALIGPAGERLFHAAGISNLDKDGVPARINARGGLGAVLGAKGIKALVIDSRDGQPRPIHSPLPFQAERKHFTEVLLAQPQTEVYRDFGTDGVARLAYAHHALPTRNFSTGQFEGLEQIAAEALRETILARHGNPSHACMPGCAIRCSNNYPTPDGSPWLSPLEYENIGLMGSNLGIASLDDIARLNWKANDLGLDTIDLGAALGLAAQAGLFAFGDGAGALALLDEIDSGTPHGVMLAHGAAATARALGITRAPVVKGQAMSAYDPRALKGTGVTYATSPQGADHTAGLTIRARIDHLNPTIQVEISRSAQYNMAGFDTLGACTFTGSAFTTAPECLPALLATALGWPAPPTVLTDLGRETLRVEREFNRRAGFTPADDRLPDWMRQEALPEIDSVFDVSNSDLDHLFNEME